jgi:hypothetical protein
MECQGVATVRGVPEPLASCDASPPGPMVTAMTMQHLEPQTRWRRKDDHSHLSRRITNRLTISTHLSPEHLNETDEMDGTAFPKYQSPICLTFKTRPFKASLMRGLMEEMELHESLDMDAEGEIESTRMTPITNQIYPSPS